MNDLEQKTLGEFKTLKSSLEDWGEFVDDALMHVLSDMFDEHLVKMAPSHRLKEDRSYLLKSLYRKKGYPNPLVDIQDKVATRVILLKSNDINLAKDKILAHTDWRSKVTKSTDEEVEYQPKYFDYQSVHIVVWPMPGNHKFPEELIPMLSCEIQIRTLLQHAFAEISHDSTYKGPYKNDKEILRRLAKTMALMEATDDYFCDIFKMMMDKKRLYDNYINEFIRLFNEFQKFKPSDIDHSILDDSLELLELKSVSIDELEAFVEKMRPEFRKVIKAGNGILFQQPVIILLLYYFYHNQGFLKKNWPFSHESILNLFKVMNTAYEQY
ncbi:MAG: RelA/SpoT domain-containing protein [Saprospiraceae bacterium]|nr:RelA/SpoT domain-containing protein [Saprospiraceae bacterium]